ncbi:hypothetical protein [Streptomyces beihaiensis]|uniref:DUF4232 domain-containing protein n=1 Tax=Streptomyces beihaiensis TaxID=2984495 RepID=A0ABT3TUR7_9ACTN|nr:hypothetical protein [Streptomyces beihaiensis]MCX3060784.1 hypothetical protein [Streptomyces beihaiensis]
MSPGDEPRERFERRERHERNEYDAYFEQDEFDEQAGNTNVNDGPPHRRTGAENEGEGDEALRQLMRQAVADIEPSDGSLDKLRRAVPARRARKRQALVGGIAASVLVALAVPAALHVANGGISGVDPAIAGHSEAEHSVAGTSSASADAGRSKQVGGTVGGSGGRTGTGRTHGKPATPSPDATEAVTSPTCAADELTATASIGNPDADGKVYGSFRVSNISKDSCTVDGPGTVQTIAQGAADATKVSVVDHTKGDAATGLPDPSTEVDQIVLKPGMAYEIRFAWVPSAACTPSGGGTGSTGGDATASPSPSPSASGGGSTGGTGGTADHAAATSTATTSSGMSTQMGTGTDAGTGTGGSGDGSVAVSHTAEPGDPSAAATIANACAGTVYRTGVLPASSP